MKIRSGHGKIIGIMTALFVLAVLVGGGTLGYFWYRKAHLDQQAASPGTGGTVQIDTSQKVETEKLETALIIPKSTDKPGDSIKLSSMTMTAPKSWRTLNGRNVINTPLQSVYAESYNDVLAQLVMVPQQNPADPLLAMNSLSLYNVTTWMTKSTAGASGTVTPANKLAYITNIENLANGKATDSNACKNGAGVLNTTICGEMLKPVTIVTSDKSMKGIAFLGTTAQAVTYDPQVFVFLTGKVKDQQLMAYGSFHLMDQNSHQLDATDNEAIKSAWNSFVGGNVPSDTMQLYRYVTDAIKSISLQIN